MSDSHATRHEPWNGAGGPMRSGPPPWGWLVAGLRSRQGCVLRFRRNCVGVRRGFLSKEGAVDEARENGTENGRQPEEPELRERPSASDEGRAGAAGRIDGKICNRNTDQVDEREAKSDGDGREPF